MMVRFLAAFMLGVCFACGFTPIAMAETAHIRHLWTVDKGLFEPESVAIDEARNMIYVSNVVGYGKNGQGYISQISMSGRMVTEKWITGLDAPTGMVLSGDKLYFADFDRLKVADVKTGAVLAAYPVAESEPCLNDVAVAPDGKIYVSASCSEIIYRLDGNQLEPFIRHPEALKFANGLFVAEDMLFSGGWQIWIWNRHTGAPLANGPITRQADVKDIDGVAWDGEAFLLSMVGDARLWRLGADGQARPISEEAFNAGDFEYDATTGLLVMPRIVGEKDHRVSAYRLTFE